MNNTNNPLICDSEQGICGLPGELSSSQISLPTLVKPIKLLYFTDPICSSCWGIEPQLRKLKLEYGKYLEISYHMGGLLPDWSYNSGGISKPSDVARHWDEVSGYYGMPIDGDLWLEDPLHSSFPPSIAFTAARMQDSEKAISFLRIIREMVFLQKKNITKWRHLEEAANQVGLDVARFNDDFEGRAKMLFEKDLILARQYGVRGFPTMFFLDSGGKQETVYGTKPYTSYENAIQKLNPDLAKLPYEKDWESLFAQYSSLTAREFAELSETPRSEAENTLDNWVAEGLLKKITTKNGAIWIRK